jgi:hypothetical protein
MSRTSSIVNLLGLSKSGSASASSSRKPSATDLKSMTAGSGGYFGHNGVLGHGLTPAFPGLANGNGNGNWSGSGSTSGSHPGSYNNSPTALYPGIVPSVQVPAFGPGAGLGPAPLHTPPYQYSVSAPGTPYLASSQGASGKSSVQNFGADGSRGSSPGFVLAPRVNGEESK